MTLTFLKRRSDCGQKRQMPAQFRIDAAQAFLKIRVTDDGFFLWKHRFVLCDGGQAFAPAGKNGAGPETGGQQLHRRLVIRGFSCKEQLNDGVRQRLRLLIQILRERGYVPCRR